jgi:hypothetical protein
MHYAVERLLYRLSRSEHSDRFLLKGAMLLSVWTSRPYRSTRDLDLAGRGDSSTTGAEAIFRGLCGLKVEDDGLVFDGASVKGKPIREDQEYEGVRVTLMARLGNARIPLQVDIGFGDAVQPLANHYVLHSLRKYWASTVAQQGMNWQVMLKMFGHSDFELILRVYYAQNDDARLVAEATKIDFGLNLPKSA